MPGAAGSARLRNRGPHCSTAGGGVQRPTFLGLVDDSQRIPSTRFPSLRGCKRTRIGCQSASARPDKTRTKAGQILDIRFLPKIVSRHSATPPVSGFCPLLVRPCPGPPGQRVVRILSGRTTQYQPLADNPKPNVRKLSGFCPVSVRPVSAPPPRAGTRMSASCPGFVRKLSTPARLKVAELLLTGGVGCAPS